MSQSFKTAVERALPAKEDVPIKRYTYEELMAILGTNKAQPRTTCTPLLHEFVGEHSQDLVAFMEDVRTAFEHEGYMNDFKPENTIDVFMQCTRVELVPSEHGVASDDECAGDVPADEVGGYESL